MAGQQGPRVLVGRENELAALASAWQAALDGRPSVVLVGGEAGIGKTAVLEEFSDGLPHEALVLRGQCVDLVGRGLPYAPVIGVLSDLVRRLGREVVIRLAGAWRSDLARLIPDLGPAAPDSETSRSRLFQAVVWLLENVASRQPVSLVLEDLHWADDSTLELLRYAVRTVHGGRLLLVGSFRSDELTRRHPLTPVLADLATASRVSQVHLPRLDAEQTTRMLRDHLAEHFDPSVVDHVVARSEGVPFYAEELARASSSGARGLPTTLAEVLSARVHAVADDTRQVLEVAAVGGTEVVEADLVAVARLSVTAVGHALSEGVERHHLVRNADSVGFRFRHALLREALLDGMLPGRLATLHRRWAEYLSAASASGPDAGQAVRVAQHWRSAHDTGQAFAASLDAARLLRSAAAPDEELRMLEQALGLWDVIPDAAAVAGTDRAALHEAAARASSQAGESQRALDLQTAALNGVDPTRDPVRHASLRLERLRLTEPLGRQVTDETEKVLSLLPPSEPASDTGRVGARAMAMLARGRVMQGDYVEGERLARDAVDYARRAGEHLAEAHALNLLGNALDGLGRSEEALAARYERQPLVDELDDPFAKAVSRHNLAVTLVMLGRIRESVVVAREGRQVATDLGLGRSEGVSYASLEAESLTELGEWDGAAGLCAQALALSPSANDAVELTITAATIAVWRGDPDATERLERAGYWMNHIDDAWFRLPWATLRGRAALEAGDPAAAAAALASGMADPDAVFHPIPAGRFLHTCAHVLGSTTPAGVESSGLVVDEVLTRLDELPAGAETPIWRALCRAELSAPDRSLDAWTTCVELLSNGRVEGLTYQKAYARYRLGQAQQQSGEDRAVATLREAQTAAEQLRALPLLQRIVDAVRECDGQGRTTARRRAPANAFSMTAREYEVLALVSQGLSNTQIASRLFVSPKTVSVHVSNILSKMDVHDRHEAAQKGLALGIIAEK